tara:strand:- start:82 stop:207 length:126 start_codon:yes stop_codon:yes gene_type:complete
MDRLIPHGLQERKLLLFIGGSAEGALIALTGSAFARPALKL